MQIYILEIIIELHIFFKNSTIKELRDLSYDNSQSTFKDNN